ncbi:MAG: hypothetical protein D3922_09220, partial [Candidatus Electrothrix sp. AR1]|nr:hypothetical protein [Candidatus Electrothrix sp. AR1]
NNQQTEERKGFKQLFSNICRWVRGDDEVLLDKCRWRLAIIWFCGGGGLYLFLIFQSAFGFYGGDEKSIREVWGWFLPNILPTLSLIIGSTFTFRHTQSTEKISRMAARFYYFLSIGYLLTLGLTIYIVPIPHELGIKLSINRIEFLKSSSLWLAPFQGLVTATLGSGLIFTRSSLSADNSA